jgi:3-hydroxyacyl-CoA dehydrogenase/3a,7a,12a-trihydroxy-5b-cholest-24-enoyl-CoA hydratase
MFMKKIDQTRAIEIVTKLRGASGAGAQAAPAAAATGAPTSAEGFAVIADYVQQNPGLAGQIGKTFLFKLTNPDSAWSIDLKNGQGAVTQGGTTADCVLELSDADFQALVAGKADAQKLYFGGQLKISGDLMASQKLMFMKKIDQKRAIEVVTKLRGAGGASAAPAAAATAPAAAKEPIAPRIKKALEARIASTPALVSEVGAVVQLQITGPDASFTLDLKNGKGSLKDGADAQADIVLKLTDEELGKLVASGNVRDAYQHGLVRIDGDVRIAHRLSFFKGL